MSEWIKCSKKLPSDGQKVICYGNKTICCEEDMEPAAEHTAIYEIKMSEWREDEAGNKYDIQYYDVWNVDDDYHVLNVTQWKPIAEEKE